MIAKDLYPPAPVMSRLVMLSDATRLRPYAAVAEPSGLGACILGRNEPTTERVRMPSGGQIPSKHGISLHSGGLSQCYRSLRQAQHVTSGTYSAGGQAPPGTSSVPRVPVAGSAEGWPPPLTELPGAVWTPGSLAGAYPATARAAPRRRRLTPAEPEGGRPRNQQTQRRILLPNAPPTRRSRGSVARTSGKPGELRIGRASRKACRENQKSDGGPQGGESGLASSASSNDAPDWRAVIYQWRRMR